MSAGLHSFAISANVLGSQNSFSDLLELSEDPFYTVPGHTSVSKRGSFLRQTTSQEEISPFVEKLRKLNLDITRISDRILVMGRCWTYRTDKAACRNNIEEIACFLNARYEKNYLIINLGSPDTKYDTVPFRNQAIAFPISKILTPTVKTLFNVVRSISAWLQLNNANVIVIQCKNGKSRSGLAIACFLRYCGLFDSAYESFEYFVGKRSKEDTTWISVTLKRYLRYFNDILILDGKVPNSIPLQLHQVILTTIPNFDGQGGCDPGIEVYQEGKLIYSSVVRLMELGKNASYDQIGQVTTPMKDQEADEELLRDLKISMVLDPGKYNKSYNPLVMMDEYVIIFRLDNVIVEKDVQVRVFHHSAQSGQNLTIFNLAFNTGFMASGLVRLRKSDLELPFDGSVGDPDDKRFDDQFSVDLIVTEVEDQGVTLVSYETCTSKSLAKDLMKLSQCHPVRPDPLLAKPLELQGHRKFFGKSTSPFIKFSNISLAKLALQLGDNDIHSAHEFLATLSKAPHYDTLDREFTLLSKQQLEQKQLPVTKEVKTEKPKIVEIVSEEEPKKAEKRLNQPEIQSVPVAPPLPPFIKNSQPASPTNILSSPIPKAPDVPVFLQSSIPIPPPLPPFIRSAPTSPIATVIQTTSPSCSSEARSPPLPPPPFPLFIKPSVPTAGAPPPAPPLPQFLQKATGGPPPPPPLPPFIQKPSGGAPPPPPPPPFMLKPGGASSIPPPPPSFSPPLAPPMPTTPKETEAPRHKIKNALHWGEIRDEAKLKNTIWSELEDHLALDKHLDVHKFEELFCINPEEEKMKKRTGVKPEKEPAKMYFMDI